MTTENQKISRLAIFSFAFGIGLWLMWCLFYGTLGIMAETNNLDETTGLVGFIFGPVVLGAITLLLGIAGIATGVQALRKHDPRRALAIAGLALNFICLCPTLALLLFMAVSNASSIPDALKQFMATFGL